MSDAIFERCMAQTFFTREELSFIHQNYKTLSSSITDDGLIDSNEFRQLMSCHGDTIFTDALFRMFDRDNSGSVDFEEFVLTLSIYQNKSRNADQSQKYKLFFRVFDVDRDNEISERDLCIVLQSCFRSNDMQVSEEDIKALVRTTMDRYPLTSRGTISFEAYSKNALQNGLANI